MIRSIISYISVFTLLVSLVNILLSIIVYYGINGYANEFARIRWFVSFAIVLALVLNKNVIIN